MSSGTPSPRPQANASDEQSAGKMRKKANRQKLPRLWPFSHLGEPTSRFTS